MGEDVHRVVEVGEGVHAVAGDVLDGVFAADFFGHLRRGEDAAADVHEPAAEVALVGLEAVAVGV